MNEYDPTLGKSAQEAAADINIRTCLDNKLHLPYMRTEEKQLPFRNDLRQIARGGKCKGDIAHNGYSWVGE